MTLNARQIERTIASCVRVLKPPPSLTVTEWADKFRYLSSEASAESGKYYSARAPYQRDPMNDFNDRSVERIILKWGSQLGKTEVLNNMAGYVIDQDPGPALMVQPTEQMARTWSTDRLTPMMRDTPALSHIFGRKKLKTSDNRLLYKAFPGGHITLAGANAPANLASRPIRYLFLDEEDRFPLSAGREGSPKSLSIKRTETFHNKKIVECSTPTVKGKSEIEHSYDQSSQASFHMPCPGCGEDVLLEFEHCKFERDANKELIPDSVHFVCEHNGCIIEEHHKPKMLAEGHWVHLYPDRKYRGYYLNSFYSPWKKWASIIDDFLEAKDLPDKLKTWINTTLAKTWDESQAGEGVEAETLSERTEEYAAPIPKGVYMLTAAVDVQDDRLEVEVLGWGMNYETWSIDYRVIWGDPASSDVWDSLDDILTSDYQHELGVSLKPAITLIDVGGHHSESVYQFVKKKSAQKRRVYGCRGSSTRNRPIFDKISRNNSYNVRVCYIGTDTAKELIYSYLAKDSPGAGYMHHPHHYDDTYFAQLTAERKVLTYEKGKSVVKWDLPSGKRNEALDLKVYNFAAYRVLKPDMAKVRARFLARSEKKSDHKPDEPSQNESEKAEPVRKKRPVKRKRKKSNYVKGWNSI